VSEILDIRPFSCRHDYERVVDYFLTADDDLLRGMGVARCKLPAREQWVERLASDLERYDREKRTFYVAWMYNGEPVGHSNINGIQFGDQAHMHLHIWKPDLRHAGLGFEFLKKSACIYFDRFELRKLICEPWAGNAAPNRCLRKVGFKFVRCYRTVPSPINLELEANRYELTLEMRESWREH
jgi:RimJ/RimL family protein N-acetyltransferase